MIRDGTHSLAKLVSALKAGDLDLDRYLDELRSRFEAVDPQILAFVPEPGRFARLKREAEHLMTRFPDAAARPPLFGLPVGVKDIFHVDGLPTRAGSSLPPEDLGGPQAEVVDDLTAAGALVLGKTVTTEFAYFAPGPARNPHNVSHTPGGSSSGSAAAVAAGLAPLALGSQTIGSITRPASFCGVVGFKPSYDRVSRDGIIPLAPSVDHVGYFTAAVDGTALVAAQICRGWDPRPPAARPTLGIPAGPYLERAEPEGLALFDRAWQALAASGYTIRRAPAWDDFSAIEARHNLLVAAEAARVHSDWFARFGSQYHPKTVALLRRGQEVSADELRAARDGRLALRNSLQARMEEAGIDLWISPAAPGPAPEGLDSTGDPIMNLPWTHSGLPTLSLPIGRDPTGLPVGLQVAAGWYADEALLAWARDLAAALKGEV